MYDSPQTYASYWEGRQAFEDGNHACPYPKDDVDYGPWRDGHMDAFDDSIKENDMNDSFTPGQKVKSTRTGFEYTIVERDRDDYDGSEVYKVSPVRGGSDFSIYAGEIEAI